MPDPTPPRPADPEQAPAVPAAIPPEGAFDWRWERERDRAEHAEHSATFWEGRYEVAERQIDHARYKTALYALGGCLLFLGLLLLALHVDMRRRVDQ